MSMDYHHTIYMKCNDQRTKAMFHTLVMQCRTVLAGSHFSYAGTLSRRILGYCNLREILSAKPDIHTDTWTWAAQAPRAHQRLRGSANTACSLSLRQGSCGQGPSQHEGGAQARGWSRLLHLLRWQVSRRLGRTVSHMQPPDLESSDAEKSLAQARTWHLCVGGSRARRCDRGSRSQLRSSQQMSGRAAAGNGHGVIWRGASLSLGCRRKFRGAEHLRAGGRGGRGNSNRGHSRAHSHSQQCDSAQRGR